MNLLIDKWIPNLVNGRIERVSVADAYDLTLMQMQSGRPEFDFALLLILIGMRQTGYRPDPLLGPGPRFLQDPRAQQGVLIPIGSLLLDEPGAIAVKQNRDHFIKGGQRDRLCPACAALALYVRCTFGGPGGSGYYPGNLFHSMLYLIERDTVTKTVNANLVGKDVTAAAYFSAPVLYWMEEPAGSGECATCGITGPVITYYRRMGPGQKPERHPNPHAARTTSGARYVIGPDSCDIDIIEGAAWDSDQAITPVAIAENAKTGDPIRAFGTFYDKATLKRLISTRFRLRGGFDYAVMRQLVRSVWRVKFPAGKPLRWDSSIAAEIRANYASSVLNGQPETQAALAVFDLYCPNPGRIDRRRYPTWKHWRNMIEDKGTAHV